MEVPSQIQGMEEEVQMEILVREVEAVELAHQQVPEEPVEMVVMEW
jgi:hypothetical protein